MKFSLVVLAVLSFFSFCSPSNTEPTVPSPAIDSAQKPYVETGHPIVDTLATISDTVIQVGNYKLSFQEVHATPIPELYDDHLSRQERLYSHTNSFEAAKELEKYLSKTQGEYFQRIGDILQLRLSGGKTLTLKDHPQEGDEAEYFLYENYFPSINAYLIRIQWYEGNGYLLVDRETGEKTEVIGPVYPSPTGAEGLSVNEDIEAGFSTNGFEWIGKEQGKFVHRFTIVAGNWSPAGVKWIDDRNLILMVKRSVDENLTDFVTEYYRLTLQ